MTFLNGWFRSSIAERAVPATSEFALDAGVVNIRFRAAEPKKKMAIPGARGSNFPETRQLTTGRGTAAPQVPVGYRVTGTNEQKSVNSRRISGCVLTLSGRPWL